VLGTPDSFFNCLLLFTGSQYDTIVEEQENARNMCMDTPTNQPELDKTLSSGAEIIRQFLPNSPFVGHLGIQLIDMQKDQATLKLPFASSLVHHWPDHPRGRPGLAD
jgi:hypothetical protein